MLRNNIKKPIASFSLGLLLINSILAAPAWAGRYVLNQTPQTIQRHFGRYQSRRVTNEGVVYTYRTIRFSRLFPQFPKSNFSITFVNNRAHSLALNFNSRWDDINGSNNFDELAAAKFYNYIFGYQPPAWKQVSSEFVNDTIYNYVYCLGDGVATSFTRYGYRAFSDGASFYYDSQCELSAQNQ